MPDLGGELTFPLLAADDLLTTVAHWEDLGWPRWTADGSAPELPQPLRGRAALDVVQRVAAVLAPTQTAPPRHRKQRSPEGLEHVPLVVVEVPTDDLTALSAAAAALGHPGLRDDVVDLVGVVAQRWGDTYRRVGRTELVSQLARLAGVLDLATTEETHTLVRCLRSGAPHADITFTDAEERAYTSFARRFDALWDHGWGLDSHLS